MTILKKAISYFAAFFAGMYFLCLCDGEIDFFMVLGFVVCVVLTLYSAVLDKSNK